MGFHSAVLIEVEFSLDQTICEFSRLDAQRLNVSGDLLFSSQEANFQHGLWFVDGRATDDHEQMWFNPKRWFARSGLTELDSADVQTRGRAVDLTYLEVLRE